MIVDDFFDDNDDDDDGVRCNVTRQLLLFYQYSWSINVFFCYMHTVIDDRYHHHHQWLVTEIGWMN